MQLIDRSLIVISPDRQRKEFEPVALNELSETIINKGLMHAVVLREDPLLGMVLVAGERRLRAIDLTWMLGSTFKYNGVKVPEGKVPYANLGQLSHLEAEEAELEENLHRKDLTWQESSAAMAKLHRIRSAQAQAEGRIHTIADTAMETKGRSDGSYHENVRREVLLAAHLNNPSIAAAKDPNEAYKILKRQEESKRNIQLSATIGKTFASSIHEALNVDCLQWMANCDPDTFDVILTDPPYGMGAQKFQDGGDSRFANKEHQYDDSYDSWKKLMAAWCPLSFKVTKRQAHAYIFCDIDNFHELKAMMQAAGWYVFRTPLIHSKPNSGRVPLPDKGPRRQYETILYAIKGDKFTNSIQPDVLVSFADANVSHGAQKPVAVFENLLSRSVRPGDVVLDSFSGSGVIFPAAHGLQCKAVGLELSAEYFPMGVERIRELDRPVDVVAGAALGMELAGMMGRR